MHKVTARVRFYSIEKCGYYTDGKENEGKSSFEFGKVDEILADLERWVKGKKLNETSTYGDENDSLYPTYCYGVQSNDFGDYFITTWNTTAESSKPIASVAGEGPVGRATVNLTKILDGYIPGFPTYFWVIPSIGKIATIQFKERKQGLVELRPYLKRFMANHSSYCIKGPAKENKNGEIIVEILGYSETGANHPRPLRARFDTKFYENINRNLIFVRARRSQITKVLRQTSLSKSTREQATILGNIFSYTGLTNAREEDLKVKFDYGIELPKPSEKELDEIIANWEEKTNEQNGTHEKLGFHIAGEEKKVVWVDSAYLSQNFELRVSQEKGKFISLDSLNTAISSIRQSILEDVGLSAQS